jgi:hypothetical protein
MHADFFDIYHIESKGKNNKLYNRDKITLVND